MNLKKRPFSGAGYALGIHRICMKGLSSTARKLKIYLYFVFLSRRQNIPEKQGSCIICWR
nr:MAG TPA_asm: hypothetical protein [Caudoviricetes sp.]